MLTRRGVNEAIEECRVGRQQAGEIARRQAEQSRCDGLMGYGRTAMMAEITGEVRRADGRLLRKAMSEVFVMRDTKISDALGRT